MRFGESREQRHVIIIEGVLWRLEKSKHVDVEER
jgi:hypothetical protein